MTDYRVTEASNYFDLNSLDQLRKKALNNEKESIREVANQFEAMFATMLIKSMRQANEAFETDSPFNNKQTKFYTDMQDKQLALDISRHGALGLADALVNQLDPTSMITPKEINPDKLVMPGVEQSSMMDFIKIKLADDFNKQDQTVASVAEKSENKILMFKDKQSFIDTLLPYAKKAAKVLGVSPAALIAQSALETGWGKKVISANNHRSSFNLFNIKADEGWQGDNISKNSLEIENGIGVERKSRFRAYDNISQSFNDYQSFIKQNQRYAEALKQGENAERYVEELQKAGYATDPQYAEKIKQIMKGSSFQLTIKRGEF
ncbi:MAG: flagellar assembly peptidoglycan hydrolase FlgJ [Psychromonas sp.]|nr:flagellar assembly peptidoglycan hydrolase FlgJ [Psychromonas sp.]